MLGRISAPMDATGDMGTSQSDRKWNGLSEKCQWEMIGLKSIPDKIRLEC